MGGPSRDCQRRRQVSVGGHGTGATGTCELVGWVRRGAGCAGLEPELLMTIARRRADGGGGITRAMGFRSIKARVSLRPARSPLSKTRARRQLEPVGGCSPRKSGSSFQGLGHARRGSRACRVRASKCSTVDRVVTLLDIGRAGRSEGLGFVTHRPSLHSYSRVVALPPNQGVCSSFTLSGATRSFVRTREATRGFAGCCWAKGEVAANLEPKGVARHRTASTDRASVDEPDLRPPQVRAGSALPNSRPSAGAASPSTGGDSACVKPLGS